MSKTNLYLDTEFNGFEGSLISLALVSPEGHEFYEVLDYSSMIVDPWVQKHVIPVLNKPSINCKQFQQNLKNFLNQFQQINIVCDWPEDIVHFTKFLINGPGTRILHPPMTFELDYNLPDTSIYSKIPHNALEDARALTTVLK